MSSQTSSSLNRRQFLGDSARNAATAAAGVVGLSGVSAGQSEQTKPQTKLPTRFDDQIRIGIVGIRNQGLALARAFQQIDGVRISGICDLDADVRARAMSKLKLNSTTKQTEDYQALLENDQLDAVVIATPDHHHAWMTALAAAAGKHVYLEVPLTHSPGEAAQLTTLVDRSGIIFQAGLQHRSGEHYRSAIELLRAGDLGRIRLAKAWSYAKRQPLLSSVSSSSGSGPLNHEQQQKWLGSESHCPFALRDWHFNWRYLWNFGSGELGTWGVHLLDLARWGMQLQTPQQVIASGGIFHFQDQRETPDTMQVQFTFDESAIIWEHRQWLNRGPEGRPHGVAFYTENGTLVIDRSGWKVYDCTRTLGQSAAKSLEPHVQNFVDAIRTGNPVTANLQTGIISSDLCHAGNRAFRDHAV